MTGRIPRQTGLVAIQGPVALPGIPSQSGRPRVGRHAIKVGVADEVRIGPTQSGRVHKRLRPGRVHFDDDDAGGIGLDDARASFPHRGKGAVKTLHARAIDVKEQQLGSRFFAAQDGSVPMCPGISRDKAAGALPESSREKLTPVDRMRNNHSVPETLFPR
jgi:hypothetical protein